MMRSVNSYHPQNGERFFLSFRVNNRRLSNYGHRSMAQDWLGANMQFPDARSASDLARILGMDSPRVLRARQDHGSRLYEEAVKIKNYEYVHHGR